MGCAASKLSNEDSVRQCKSRRHLIKSAVIARHHLAAAHSDYLHSLKSTGSALATFASGEPLHVSEHSPAILLPSTKPPATIFRSPISTPKPTHTGPTGQTTQTSQTGQTGSLNNTHRRPKLPHILSESSEASYSPNPKKFTYNAQGNYNSTPSQASSVWNWENFYPPSPPDSEYFNNRKPNSDSDDDTSSIYSNYTRSTQRTNRHNPEVKMKNIRRMDSEDDTSSIYSNYTQRTNPHNPEVKTFRRPDQSSETESERVRGYGGRNLNNMEVKTFRRPDFNGRRQNSDIPASETESERDGDAPELYSTSSSTSGDYDEENDRETRSEDESRSNFGSSVYGESVARAPPSAAKSKVSGGDSGEYDGDSDMRMVIRHRDLAEIVAAINEWFDKAAEAGGQVAEMMETGGDQLDRSFRKLKKKVYHSSGVLSNLSSSWTSKPPLAIKYRFEPDSIGEPGGPGGSKSLCSTLDRLMAWEMKLYQEVKAREGVKIEHERKLSTLQSQEYKGEEESKLNKTKASIKKLQSLIVVTSQAVSTTSTAIVGLRDAELVPQLIELCHGLMYMWRSMNQCHEVQNHVVQQVRGLVTRSTKGESTSDLHRQATRDLEAAVSAWHSSFCRLIKFQRDFIKSLQGWFKLTLLPIDDANLNGSQPSDVYIVFDEWKLALDRLPDTVASEAIKSFINVVHSISLKQAEEMKVKKRTESASKELEKKASSLRTIEKKYYHSYSMVGLGLPGSGQDDGYGLDARDPLSEKKTELVACQRRVEDEMLRHSKAVEVTRSMTLNNIQTGLPGVFQAMTSFSGLIMEALEFVCNKSYAVK